MCYSGTINVRTDGRTDGQTDRDSAQSRDRPLTDGQTDRRPNKGQCPIKTWTINVGIYKLLQDESF